ncbi:GGDEF domain-containing protein [Pseudoruegeria sp. HB172150]|uniref:GGDEF domain-containing protein n=1 Tax=Pseudoruegeria sp. HB172150 TaxID=2721164 RepID=UPI0015519C48|nr:GGDEF domain-containing protein [Pseudoruegeria sp. HB172150]
MTAFPKLDDAPAAELDVEALDAVMPLAVIIDAAGHIIHAGPTLRKLREGVDLRGCGFFHLFALRRPRSITDFTDLATRGGGALQLQFLDPPATAFKGLAVPLRDGAGLLINLSFGIGAVEALGVYDLTSADFPPTDLTVEMLYLVEANAAVQGELRGHNRRLQGARVVAEEQAHTDMLTGLRNRREMDMVLERYTRSRDRFSLMHVDLDFFKQVNDAHGHAAGDHVLQEVAAILVEETRESDTVVRAGGDEFVLIFYRLTDRDRLARIATRLLRRLEQPIAFGERICRISGSIGIAVSQDYESPDAEQMLRDADMALYVSKNAGRARYCFAGGEALSAMAG